MLMHTYTHYAFHTDEYLLLLTYDTQICNNSLQDAIECKQLFIYLRHIPACMDYSPWPDFQLDRGQTE